MGARRDTEWLEGQAPSVDYRQGGFHSQEPHKSSTLLPLAHVYSHNQTPGTQCMRLCIKHHNVLRSSCLSFWAPCSAGRKLPTASWKLTATLGTAPPPGNINLKLGFLGDSMQRGCFRGWGFPDLVSPAGALADHLYSKPGIAPAPRSQASPHSSSHCPRSQGGKEGDSPDRHLMSS